MSNLLVTPRSGTAELENSILSNRQKFESLSLRIGVDEIKSRVEQIRLEMLNGEFWADVDRSTIEQQKLAADERTLGKFSEMETALRDASAAFDLIDGSDQAELVQVATESLDKFAAIYKDLDLKLKMKGKYDGLGAILEIHPGAGGKEACAWALMLREMYLGWIRKSGFELTGDHCQYGPEAGITESALVIEGAFAFGHLRSEAGSHRLMRFSPFDSNGRRQTSFVSVKVTPILPPMEETLLRDEDLRIDKFCASGPGGQHINKTESAVRVTHVPTGLVAACQSERSQRSNLETAKAILLAKLAEHHEREQQERKLAAREGDQNASFGNRIRSYSLQPDPYVKDERTGLKITNVDGVLSGRIDPLIESFLSSDFNNPSF